MTPVAQAEEGSGAAGAVAGVLFVWTVSTVVYMVTIVVTWNWLALHAAFHASTITPGQALAFAILLAGLTVGYVALLFTLGLRR